MDTELRKVSSSVYVEQVYWDSDIAKTVNVWITGLWAQSDHGDEIADGPSNNARTPEVVRALFVLQLRPKDFTKDTFG
jgi:hypothetical protein